MMSVLFLLSALSAVKLRTATLHKLLWHSLEQVLPTPAVFFGTIFQIFCSSIILLDILHLLDAK